MRAAGAAVIALDASAPHGLRVAVVTETYPPEVNGVAMTLGRLVDGLRRRGHAVSLVRPRQPGEPPPIADPDLDQLLLPGLPIPGYAGLRFGLPARGALIAEWSRRRPDIVHVVTEGPLGWSALGVARALNLPVSTGFHTNFDAYCAHYGVRWLSDAMTRYLRNLHNRADVTLVPTQSLARRLDAQGYRNLAVVARGVDTGLFRPDRRSTALREAWGLVPDELAVCCVGRMAAEKNLDLVLAAFAAIKRMRPDARLVFVGDGPLRRPLARRFPEHIFAGLRHGEDLATHYASADLFLFPSLTETFGNVTAEALASGLGVVAYDCAAAADLIRDGDNGCLAAVDDENAFIKAALFLATNTAELARLRRRAALAVAHLDWERIHDSFAAALGQSVGAHRQAGTDTASTVVAAALD